MPIVGKMALGDPNRDYMTQAEMAYFTRQRSLGKMTMFRVGKCSGCQKEIHKSKKYCSKQCKIGEDHGTETERVD